MFPFWDLLAAQGKESFVREFVKEKRQKKLTSRRKTICNRTSGNLAALDSDVEEITRLLSLQNEVQAIALGGSRASGKADDTSDYDIYVYLYTALDDNIRKQILSPFCQYMEIGNTYWETEDNCILLNGVCIDIIYRNSDNFIQGLIDVVEDGTSFNGYTTCMWQNAATSKIIYEENDYLTNAQNRFSVPYPEYLKNNIIKRNMNLLTYSVVSYDKQIKKSIHRQDMVNINNRISAFLASYFDVIFALNEMQHPGEKHLMEICIEKCSLLPAKFEENIKALFFYMGKDITKITSIIESMIYELNTSTKKLSNRAVVFK